MKLTNAKILILAAVCGLVAGCIAYRAPVVSYQRGAENAYQQDRNGLTSRSTGNQQQVAETTSEQQQQENTQTADMPTATEATKQLGLKQGLAGTTTKTQGDASPGTTTSEQVPTGQQGGDATSFGAQPIANADNAAANTDGTASNTPTGSEAVTQPAAPAPAAAPVEPAPTE